MKVAGSNPARRIKRLEMDPEFTGVGKLRAELQSGKLGATRTRLSKFSIVVVGTETCIARSIVSLSATSLKVTCLKARPLPLVDGMEVTIQEYRRGLRTPENLIDSVSLVVGHFTKSVNTLKRGIRCFEHFYMFDIRIISECK